MEQLNTNMRDFNITRNKGEWYYAVVTDSYGNKYDNHFEHAHEASRQHKCKIYTSFTPH